MRIIDRHSCLPDACQPDACCSGADQHDYYDCVQSYGQDQTLLYIREPKIVKYTQPRPLGIQKKGWPFPRYFGNDIGPLTLYYYIIGFCGKIYLVFNIYFRLGAIAKQSFCYNIEEIDALIDTHLSKRQKKNYYKEKWKYGFRNSLVKYFREIHDVKNNFMHLFNDNRAPIFVANYSKGIIEYNAILKPYEFFRIKDPYTAFQDITMFLSNMAVPQKPMPVISDEMKIASRGFDKWSFRKPPAG